MRIVANGAELTLMILFPKSNLLKCWITWILHKSFTLMPHVMQQINGSTSEYSLSERTSDFLGGFISPWFYGAGASNFEAISGIAIFLDLYIAIAILLRIKFLLPSVNKVMWFLFGLAMYTIWLEPWICLYLLHPEEWLNYAISEVVLKGVLFIPDAGFSWLWFFWTLSLWNSLDREFR
jgi:hypothetical protein